MYLDNPTFMSSKTLASVIEYDIRSKFSLREAAKEQGFCVFHFSKMERDLVLCIPEKELLKDNLVIPIPISLHNSFKQQRVVSLSKEVHNVANAFLKNKKYTHRIKLTEMYYA